MGSALALGRGGQWLPLGTLAAHGSGVKRAEAPEGNIIVIGASSGGPEALQALFQRIEADFPAAFLVVQHVGRAGSSYLREILSRGTSLPVHSVESRMPLEPSGIYLATPNRHMVALHGQVAPVPGPLINLVRPAVDPLFQTAAAHYGSRVIGVILTGSLDDGTVGMGAIKSCGGVTIIQDPAEAPSPSMPQSVKDHVEVDHVAAIEKIPDILAQLMEEEIPPPREIPARLKAECRILISHEAHYQGIEGQGELSAVACPECGGPLWRIGGQGLDHYRCHTGHSFTPSTLSIRMDEATEQALWTALRLLEERVRILQRMAEEAQGKGHRSLAERFDERVRETRKNANQIESLLKAL